VRGFDEFFHEEYEPVVRAITLVFDDRHRAEDFAQFAFARAYREWRPVGWVYVVALNRGGRELRRSGPEREPAALPGGMN
jgi:DNA-directed RNA polymerase specialized sigma24 family protein